jgi:tripartite-type tricarboxylate transporter receptor subunit TctC
MFSVFGLIASAIACACMAATLRSYRADILEFLARVQADLVEIKIDSRENFAEVKAGVAELKDHRGLRRRTVNAIKLAAVIQLVLIVTLWGMWLSWTTSCDARLSQQIQDLQQSFNFQIQHIQSGIEAVSPAWSCCH